MLKISSNKFVNIILLSKTRVVNVAWLWNQLDSFVGLGVAGISVIIII